LFEEIVESMIDLFSLIVYWVISHYDRTPIKPTRLILQLLFEKGPADNYPSLER
jgi:hypothetical protein